MHKIFVPVDGSDYAMRAVEYAIKVALERGPAEVNFVTVYPEPVIYGEIQVYTSPEKMEEELLKARKLQSSAIIAGGIAHDFNNILTAITGYADMILMDLSPDHPYYKHVTSILRGSRKAENLIKH